MTRLTPFGLLGVYRGRRLPLIGDTIMRISGVQFAVLAGSFALLAFAAGTRTAQVERSGRVERQIQYIHEMDERFMEMGG